MSETKPEVKDFLKKSGELLEPRQVTDEFVEVVRQENTRQIKEQLAHDLEPLLSRLATIETQQERIIQLLKEKADLDMYEREIMSLLKAKLEADK